MNYRALISMMAAGASGGGGTDSDATAFLTATGITDPTISSAINQLVLDLKAAGVWTKCYAIYPFVGGSSSTHAVNLKQPGTYDVTWSGTVTHNANGVTGNGSTGYGDTGLNALSVLSATNAHLSVYSRTDVAAWTIDIGGYDSGNSRYAYIYSKAGDNNLTAALFHASPHYISISVPNSLGHFIVSRRANNDIEGYKNGSSVQTNGGSATATQPNYNIFVCAANATGSAGSHSSRNLAFASIGQGLTDTEASNFSTAVETMQDALSRGVV